jgi:hypothetical protein
MPDDEPERAAGAAAADNERWHLEPYDEDVDDAPMGDADDCNGRGEPLDPDEDLGLDDLGGDGDGGDADGDAGGDEGDRDGDGADGDAEDAGAGEGDG